eukprot:Rmarinus@m.9496
MLACTASEKSCVPRVQTSKPPRTRRHRVRLTVNAFHHMGQHTATSFPQNTSSLLHCCRLVLPSTGVMRHLSVTLTATASTTYLSATRTSLPQDTAAEPRLSHG